MLPLAAVAVFLTFPALCAAQADALVAKPEVKAGDRWTYRRMDYKVTWAHENLRRGSATGNERTAKVVGWEDIRVPAGKFRALKVEAKGSYQRLDKRTSGSARDVFWYVPGVKRWVKYAAEDYGDAGYYENIGEELVAFAVQ